MRKPIIDIDRIRALVWDRETVRYGILTCAGFTCLGVYIGVLFTANHLAPPDWFVSICGIFGLFSPAFLCGLYGAVHWKGREDGQAEYVEDIERHQ